MGENIFMEVSARRHTDGAKYMKGLRSIIDSGYVLYGHGLKRGPTEIYPYYHDQKKHRRYNDNDKKNDENVDIWSLQFDSELLPKRIIELSVFSKQKVVNLWWKLPK